MFGRQKEYLVSYNFIDRDGKTGSGYMTMKSNCKFNREYALKIAESINKDIDSEKVVILNIVRLDKL